ncbi:radical SAM family heme chaperone HemW [Clostridium thermarum]|uniref:radical SAM family heme chaperone HemW n=1 Tax=Clostridium thermarum TaxID=1716543 RepID=UPI00111F92F6|nr:radical SAM family heme chaperone HemW [Clostridium thermarum]
MGIALYIHIPFCKSKCMYCDFCSYSGSESMMMEYTRALCDEILLKCINKSISTIFIGGGTPTYLSLEAWELLKNTIERLRLEPGAEFTVECNPGTIDVDKLKVLKSMGVNRISIGLQAWQNNLLKKIGRIHTVEDFVKSYNLIREMDFDNVNVDIMFGLPTQKQQDLEDTIEAVTCLQPEHISCYSLIVEEDTPFGELYKKGKLQLPEEDEERAMYEKAVELLEKKGYAQYEISNFAKGGYECRHNIVYWTLGDYIGCGAGAHGYVRDIRYRNEENIKKYIKAVSVSMLSAIESNKNSLVDEMEEYMFMGLRMLSGVEEAEFRRRFGVDIGSVYGEVIEKYIKLKLLERKNGFIVLNHSGIQLSNTVMSDFILDKQ